MLLIKIVICRTGLLGTTCPSLQTEGQSCRSAHTARTNCSSCSACHFSWEVQVNMLKLWNINRFLSRKLSSKPREEYAEKLIRSLDTEVHPLQVNGAMTNKSCLYPNIQAISRYYFDGSGKGIRPRITRMMAEACNVHLQVRRPPTSHLTIL